MCVGAERTRLQHCGNVGNDVGQDGLPSEGIGQPVQRCLSSYGIAE